MNILLQSFCHHQEDIGKAQVAATLLSAQCIGTDGRPCPLLHGSIACKILSKEKKNNKFQEFLAESNCIEWIDSLFFHDWYTEDQFVKVNPFYPKIIHRLQHSRYSARSLTSISIANVYKAGDVASDMLRSGYWTNIQTVSLQGELSTFDFSALSSIASSLRHLHIEDQRRPQQESLFGVALPTLVHLESLSLVENTFSDLYFESGVSPLVHLKKLVICECFDLTGSSFGNAFSKIKTNLRHLDLAINDHLTTIEGIGELENLEFLSIHCCGQCGEGELLSSWHSFPFLTTLILVLNGKPAEGALANFHAPNLSVLKLQICHEQVMNLLKRCSESLNRFCFVGYASELEQDVFDLVSKEAAHLTYLYLPSEFQSSSAVKTLKRMRGSTLEITYWDGYVEPIPEGEENCVNSTDKIDGTGRRDRE